MLSKYSGKQPATVHRILVVIHRKPVYMLLQTIIMLPELKIEINKMNYVV